VRQLLNLLADSLVYPTSNPITACSGKNWHAGHLFIKRRMKNRFRGSSAEPASLVAIFFVMPPTTAPGQASFAGAITLNPLLMGAGPQPDALLVSQNPRHKRCHNSSIPDITQRVRKNIRR